MARNKQQSQTTHHPLHLKYRPTQLSELVGQDIIHRTLHNAIAFQEIAPAYLFIGNRGTGKTSTARILAKSLNCLNSDVPTVTPCNQCQSCRSIDKSSSLDVTELDAASHNGVDDARQLIEHSNFAPAMSRYRIFILDEIHCLSNQAFNALLKTIEEPPQRVVFILCTTEAHKVLPTIVSRCQVFNFKTISTQTITKHLQTIAEAEQITITNEALTTLGRTANGGLRDALQLLSQLSLLDEPITTEHIIEATNGIHPETLFKLIKTVLTGATLEVLQISRNLIDSGKSPQITLNSLLQIYRDILIVKSLPNSHQQITSFFEYKQLKQLADLITVEGINTALNQLQKSESQLRASVNANTWLKVCLLNLSPLTSTLNDQQNNGNRGFKLRQSSFSTAEKSPDLSTIWAKVVEGVKPASSRLLSHATLTQITNTSATLTVEPQYISKFQHNQDKITRLLSKTLGYSIKTITIESW